MSQHIAIIDCYEIIPFLESLGGVNKNNLCGGGDWIPFSIDENGVIHCPVICYKMDIDDFKREYMYPVGTKVRHKNKWFSCRIEKISMRDHSVIYSLKTVFGRRFDATKDEFTLIKKEE